MNDVLRALGNAFRSMLHPRMLVLAIWPMLAALALWLGVAWIYWSNWSQWLSELITGPGVSAWLQQHDLAFIVNYSVWVLLSLLLAPLILVTAVLLAAVLAMPFIVNFVGARDYPALEKKRGGTILGSTVNALAAVLLFAGLWIVTLPLWLTGVLAPVLPVVLSGYLNQRLFRYDALADHASADEFRAIVAASRGRMYVLGTLLALLYYVPLVNLLAPIVSGLAFVHFGLAELARLRRVKVKSEE